MRLVLPVYQPGYMPEWLLDARKHHDSHTALDMRPTSQSGTAVVSWDNVVTSSSTRTGSISLGQPKDSCLHGGQRREGVSRSTCCFLIRHDHVACQVMGLTCPSWAT